MPAFTDICPECFSDDLDIFNVELLALAAPPVWEKRPAKDGEQEEDVS